MATLNPQNAVVFGATAQQFYNIFNEIYTEQSGEVTSIYNSFSTVYPFYTNSNWVTTQPPGNAQAIEDLFPSINSGPNVYFTIASTGGTWDVSSSYFEPFSNTSAVTITPLNEAAIANLSLSALISNDTIVAATSEEFTFIPGTTQTIELSYQEGTTLSNTTTNGITNTTTSGTTTTVTTGVNATGTIPGASSQVSASVAQAWTEQESQAINYSESEADTVTTNVTTTSIVNVNTATPNSDGQYVYTSSTGQSFTLTPGNEYITEIQIQTTSYSTPVPNTFNISGPDMSLEMIINSFPDNFHETVTQNVEEAIYDANNFDYSQYSGVDASLFSYQGSPVAQAVYSGLITSESVTGTNAVVVILPVATTADATSTPTVSATDTTTLSMLVSPNDVGTTNLDLHAAAVKLKSSYGIYYDNTSTENQITTRNVQISGEDHASVKVGNLEYTFKNFSNSTISTGSGDNRVIFVGTDINNSVNLGSGNSEVELNGSGNSIRMGDGANWVNVTGGTGTNFLVAGDGPTTLTFDSSSGFTQVSNWDTTADAVLFAPDIARSNVYMTFDSTHWAYDVYVSNKHVANILTTGGVKLANETSTVYPQTYAAPMPYNVKSNEGFVNGLYVDAFSRSADSAGISYWTQQLDSGASRKAVIQEFLVSAEYEIGHLANSQYVNGLYLDVLGRQEDASGAAYWVGQLDSGISRATVVGSFLASTEFNNLVGII